MSVERLAMNQEHHITGVSLFQQPGQNIQRTMTKLENPIRRIIYGQCASSLTDFGFCRAGSPLKSAVPPKSVRVSMPHWQKATACPASLTSARTGHSSRAACPWLLCACTPSVGGGWDRSGRRRGTAHHQTCSPRTLLLQHKCNRPRRRTFSAFSMTDSYKKHTSSSLLFTRPTSHRVYKFL